MLHAAAPRRPSLALPTGPRATAVRSRTMLSYVTVDVFTDEAFGGNPLAVVFGAEELSTVQMLQVRRVRGAFSAAERRAHFLRVCAISPRCAPGIYILFV